MSTVTNMKVAVKYRRNVGSLSIDKSADKRTNTLGRHIDEHIGLVSVDISTDARSICRPINQATHLDRHIDRHLTDMSTDISVDTRPICRPIHRSTVGRYVSQRVHKIHMIQEIFNLEILPWFTIKYSKATSKQESMTSTVSSGTRVSNAWYCHYQDYFGLLHMLFD